MEIGDCIIYEKLKNSPKFSWKIEKLYEMCKNKLGEIRRTFPNYTLHNIDHSIHVLYYMGQVIEEKIEQFDELELYVITCAAFLHDIGMAFSEKEKEAVKAGEYDNKKIKYKFVADRMEEKEAIKEFVRIIHAQRARKFCENYENQKGFESLLEGIASCVGKICESHDHRKEWIQKELATQKAYEKEKYNPQFIALLLRLGDILDFDCKRVPMEIFENINGSDEMSEYSRKEWKKQMGITYDEKIEKVENAEEFKVVFFGEQKDPQIYRKMLEYFHWIEEELHLVNEISESFLKDEELTKQQKEKYKIKFLENVNNHVDIPDYDFTDLKMSVDYKNITNILMGENIYGNKKYALRELLQNALDACRYLKRIRGDSDFYTPQIMIIMDVKKNQLIIKDNGIGMSKDVLENYFLSVGKSYYQSDEFLNNSYFYKPIANYGIGFLSCFLLSDEVIVKTKPYNSNEGTNCIHLKKGIEFIYWDKKEKGLYESGTEIILNYEQFQKVFLDENEIELFINENILYNDIPIKLKTDSVKNLSLSDLSENNLKYWQEELLSLQTEYKKSSSFKASGLWNIYDRITDNILTRYSDINDINQKKERSKALQNFKYEKINISDYLNGVRAFVIIGGFNKACTNIIDRMCINKKAVYEKEVLEQNRNLFIKENHLCYLEMDFIDDSVLNNLKEMREIDVFSYMDEEDIKEAYYPYEIEKAYTFCPCDSWKTIEKEIKEKKEGFIKEIYDKINDISFEEISDENFEDTISISIKILNLVYSDKFEEVFFEVKSPYEIFCKCFNKGILVNNIHKMEIENSLDFFYIKNCVLNIDNNTTILNVARDRLNEEDRKELEYSVIKATYLYFIDNYKQYNITENEKQLLEQYIELRYSETTKYLKQ